jgi:hypothetical protein
MRRWREQFYGWREWVIFADEKTLAFALSKYEERFGKENRTRLHKLMTAIRRDRTQLDRN